MNLDINKFRVACTLLS